MFSTGRCSESAVQACALPVAKIVLMPQSQIETQDQKQEQKQETKGKEGYPGASELVYDNEVYGEDLENDYYC